MGETMQGPPLTLNGTFGQDDYQDPSQGILILGMSVTLLVMVVGSLGNLLTLCTLGHQFYMPRRAR